MKSQVLHTVWCNIPVEAAGEIWHWSLLGVKGLTIIITAITTFVIIFIVSTLGYGPCSILNPQPIIIIIIVASLLAPLPSSLLSSSPPRHHGNTLFGCYCQRLCQKWHCRYLVLVKVLLKSLNVHNQCWKKKNACRSAVIQFFGMASA